MKFLKIFSDAPLTPSAQQLLHTATAPHQLITPAKPTPSVLAKSEPDPAFAHAEIAFGQPDLLNIQHSTQLRWIHLTSAGYTRYDTPEFRDLVKTRALIVTNSSGVYAQPCAEHVFAFILAQCRKLPAALGSNRASGTPAWNNLRANSTILRGQNLLILGYGAIAEKLLEMLQPFKVQVTAYRRKPHGDEPIPIVTFEQLPRALAAADHVINLLPANHDSAHFINSARLAALKPGAVLYNIGRGATVDQDALIASLKTGRLAAAWLDVTEPEPLSANHPLLAAPNCYITPHIAGGQPAEAEALVNHFLENLRLYTANQPLIDRIM